MMLTHIESYLKRPFATEFGRWNLILGDNWSGKSSLKQAIELLLTGKINEPELGSIPSKLIELRPPGRDDLLVKARFDTGAEASIHFDGPHQPTWLFDGREVVDPFGVFVDSSLSFLSSAEKRRIGLLRMITPADFDLNKAVCEHLPEPFQAYWKEIYKEAKGEAESDAAGDVLTAAIKLLKSKSRAENKSVKTETAAALAGPKWSFEDDNRIEEIEKRLNVVGKSVIEWNQRKGEAEREKTQLLHSLAQLEAYNLPDEVSDELREQADLLEAVKASKVVAKASCKRPRCLTCGSEAKVDWKVRLEKIEKAIAKLDKDTQTVRLFDLRSGARKRLQEIEEILKEPTVSAENAVENLQLKVEREELLKKKAKVAEAKESRTRAIKAEQQKRSIEAVTDACQSVLEDVILKGQDKFCAEASKWLPDGQRVAIRVFDDKAKPVCYLGLTGGGYDIESAAMDRSWATISGGERLLVKGALSRAEAVKHKTAIRLLTADELSVSVRVLGEMLKSFGRDVPNDPIDQTFVFAISNPTDQLEVPDNWTVVRT